MNQLGHWLEVAGARQAGLGSLRCPVGDAIFPLSSSATFPRGGVSGIWNRISFYAVLGAAVIELASSVTQFLIMIVLIFAHIQIHSSGYTENTQTAKCRLASFAWFAVNC